MISIFVILLSGWCRTSLPPARLVSYAFLYTTQVQSFKLELIEFTRNVFSFFSSSATIVPVKCGSVYYRL